MNRIWFENKSQSVMEAKLLEIMEYIHDDPTKKLEPTFQSLVTERRLQGLLREQFQTPSRAAIFVHGYSHYRSFATASRYNVFSITADSYTDGWMHAILIETPDDTLAVMLRLLA